MSSIPKGILQKSKNSNFKNVNKALSSLKVWPIVMCDIIDKSIYLDSVLRRYVSIFLSGESIFDCFFSASSIVPKTAVKHENETISLRSINNFLLP